ncbi:hypothetical protein BH09ACT10_BH09ACT10_04030 [soil metagenome]
MTRNTVSRSMHDLGLAAWFGGTLANAVSLNEAAAEAGDPNDAGAVANVGWDRWTPVNASAIGLHVAGTLGQILGNSKRIRAQKGVMAMVITKSVLTVGALGVTAYSRVLGARVSKWTDVPVSSGTDPIATTPANVAAAQKQLKVLQWVIPALTGAVVVVSAFAGEQERPSEVTRGLTHRIFG